MCVASTYKQTTDWNVRGHIYIPVAVAEHTLKGIMRGRQQIFDFGSRICEADECEKCALQVSNSKSDAVKVYRHKCVMCVAFLFDSALLHTSQS